MATLVEKGDGGVNLSELTSGERFLIGLLMCPVQLSINQATGVSTITYHGSSNFDVSKISNIHIAVNGNVGDRDGNGNVFTYLEVFGNSIIKTGEHDIVPRNVNTAIKLKGISMNITVTSFITTDGKVHTVDNLNY